MASIEVSLSSTTTTPRRKKASLGGQPLQRASRDTARELETLRNALRDKENVIQRYDRGQAPRSSQSSKEKSTETTKQTFTCSEKATSP